MIPTFRGKDSTKEWGEGPVLMRCAESRDAALGAGFHGEWKKKIFHIYLKSPTRKAILCSLYVLHFNPVASDVKPDLRLREVK